MIDLGLFQKGGDTESLIDAKIKLAKMSALEQLDLVKAYLKLYGRYKKVKEPKDIYTAVFWPSAIGKGDEHTMIPQSKNIKYTENQSIDKDGDGVQLGELLNDRFEPDLIKGLLARNMNKHDIKDVTVDKNGKKRLEFKFQGEDNFDCKEISDEIISSLGIFSEGPTGKSSKFQRPQAFYQLGLENESGTEIVFESLQKRKAGISYIDKALSHGDPVVVGIHYKFRKSKKASKKKHNEGTTDHFLVIIGSFKIGETKYYKYWDVGSDAGSKGFYFKQTKDFMLISNRTVKNRNKAIDSEFLEGSSYIVTQIRRTNII